MLTLRDEGRSGIVDENIERRLAPDGVHHALDGGAVADIAGHDGDLAAGLFAHLARRRFQPIELATADHELRTERKEAAPHRRAETRATTGDEDALVPKQARFKHRLNPCYFVVASEGKPSRNRTAEIAWIARQ
ncbi:hypothetical protein ACVWW2_000961 [Bradyrhizobium sp. LM4.3]